MNQFHILFFSILVLSFLSCGKSVIKESPTPVQKPNIIYIMTDDHTRQAISAYGSVINKTPSFLLESKRRGIYFCAVKATRANPSKMRSNRN